MDDNFANITHAIEAGRVLFDNLKKTVAYTVTHLWPEAGPAIMSLLFGFPLGLQPLIVLTIDLGTELGPAISLSKEDMVRVVVWCVPAWVCVCVCVRVPLFNCVCGCPPLCRRRT